MTLHDPLAEQLEGIIAKIVLDFELQGSIIISPENVANQVDKIIDPDQVAPELKTYASIMQIRQSTRSYLRRRHDPVAKMEDDISTGMDDMFSDELQKWYPAKRNDERVYVLRQEMTEKEVRICAGKMRKAGAALLRHADALEAWYTAQAS